jgi:hypothetical protein
MGFWDTLEKWGDDVISGGENTFKWGVGQGVDVIKHTEDSFSSIISTPLLLIAGGVALFLWNSNLGQTQELQKSIGPALMAG